MKAIILYNLLDTYMKNLENEIEDLEVNLADVHDMDEEGTIIQDLNYAITQRLDVINSINNIKKYLTYGEISLNI